MVIGDKLFDFVDDVGLKMILKASKKKNCEDREWNASYPVFGLVVVDLEPTASFGHRRHYR